MNSTCHKIFYTDLSRYVLLDVSKISSYIKNAWTVKNIMITARDTRSVTMTTSTHVHQVIRRLKGQISNCAGEISVTSEGRCRDLILSTWHLFR